MKGDGVLKEILKNKENYEIMDQERFYWIIILKKYNDYFETSKESWKMSTSKIQARFVKKLAMATLNFFKTAPVFMKSNFSPTTKKLTSLLIRQSRLFLKCKGKNKQSQSHSNTS